MAHPVTARILASAHQLAIVYPAVRTVATGVAPGPAPTSPLIPQEPASTVLTPDPTGYLPSVTMPCLWFDMATGTELSDMPSHEKRTFEQLGWTEAASALARVLVSDAALNTSNPYAGTRFDKADHVEHNNQRFYVLQVIPISASFNLPESYYVWLSSTKQH